MTRIMIAHRQETIEKAEKVFFLDNGHLLSIDSENI